VATRWLPGTDRDVASEAMKTNVKQLDPRLSACNYAALDQAQRKLNDLGALKGTIDVNKHVEPSFISQVEEEKPDLFEGLDQVPSSARIDEGFEFRRGGDQCPA
jgi:sulfonate transport system substrate-binding protein